MIPAHVNVLACVLKRTIKNYRTIFKSIIQFKYTQNAHTHFNFFKKWTQ